MYAVHVRPSTFLCVYFCWYVVLPCSLLIVACSFLMAKIGAEHAAHQYESSTLLLVVLFLTDFELVRLIQNAAFSSLPVLGGGGYLRGVF